VQWGDLRLYITWAKFPPEEGDWRTSKGEYFYGFEEFELTLYRVPTAPAIPLSAMSTLFGTGLVILGAVLIRRGERKGLLPALIGTVMLTALVLAFPPYAAVPSCPYARIEWIGAYSICPDENFTRFVITRLENNSMNLEMYDSWGNLLWKVRGVWGNRALMTRDGSRILVYDASAFPYPSWLLYDSSGNYLRGMGDSTVSSQSFALSNTAFVFVTERYACVYDRDGMLLTRLDVANATACGISDDGRRFALAFKIDNCLHFNCYDKTGTLLAEFTFENVNYYTAILSRTGKYAVVDTQTLQLVDNVTYVGHSWYILNIDTQSIIKSFPLHFVNFSYFPINWMFTSDDSMMAVVEGGIIRIYRPSDGSIIQDLGSLSDEFGMNATISPLGDKVVVRVLKDSYYLRAFGTDVFSKPLPIPSRPSCIPFCTEREVCPVPVATQTGKNMIVFNFKYHLEISSKAACFSVNGGPTVSSYSENLDPADRIVVDIYPDNSVPAYVGNFTDWDNLYDNRLEIFADNDKSIWIRLIGIPSVSVGPRVCRRYDNILVTWSVVDADYYEVQVDNNIDFSNPVTYTQIYGTSLLLTPPEGGWEGRHWVRVRGVIPTQRRVFYGSWSDPTYFEAIVAPSCLEVTPKNPFPLENVKLTWSSVSLVDYYEVGLDGVVIGQTAGTTCILFPPPQGWSLRRYTVSVRAVYGGVSSDWTENYFEVTPLPAPEYLEVEPLAPFAFENIRLRWARVEVADYYEIKLDEVIIGQTVETSYILLPPPEGWSVGVHKVGVRTVSYSLGKSAWTENTFSVQPVVALAGAPPPPLHPPAGRLQLAAMVPMLPHPLVSAFNVLGQVAGVYTLSLLMVLGGLGLITVGLRRVP
jgi:hypothetical protein